MERLQWSACENRTNFEISNYSIYNLGNESYYLSCPLWFVWITLKLTLFSLRFLFVRLPFIHWETPIGFCVAFTMGTISCLCVVYSILPSTCFAVGSHLFTVGAVKMITANFKYSCGKLSNENDKNIKTLLDQVILDISDLKQLSLRSI